MAVASNPCGLSFDKTMEIIKQKVVNSNYNGRDEVMKGLMQDGYSYQEAIQITNQYFQIYRRVSDKYKEKSLSTIFSTQEKLKKRLNNVAVDYLNGGLQGFPMSAADITHLEYIYEKHNKAQTPSLKEKYNEEAAVFVQQFLPEYSTELFKTSVYARPLLSAVFFIKSFTSNLHAQIERSLTNSIYDGKAFDFTFLNKFSGLANQSFLNVLKGGVPATSLYQSEANVGTAKGRIEESSLKGTDADKTKASRIYYSTMKFMSKWSNRFNAAPDTRGIFSNAERHMYQLLKEKYRGDGLNQEQATQKALQDMELDDKATATEMAVAKFKELGLDPKGTEFNVAVEEYRRRHRDEEIWGNALRLSKNDFWKRNMTVASELGFGDYGLFGLKAQAFSGLRNKLEQYSKSKKLAAFNLYAFGFLNGAANFAEDALERVPAYAAIKLSFLQAKKGNTTDAALINEIAQRQRDIIIKNITTSLFFLGVKMLEKVICPDYAGKQSSRDISGGRIQVGPCGLPFLLPPQMIPAYKMYSIISESVDNDEEFMETALNVMPVLVQSNEIGLGGSLDKLGTSMTNISLATAQGNSVKSAEEKDKAIKQITRMGADVANSFLPLPSRLTSEVGTFIQRIERKSQRQQDLPFMIDESGNKKGVLSSLGKVIVASLGNVTGISEITLAAIGSQKTYAVDWQGRKVVQFRGSDIVGSGIKYTAADDILATAGVRTPYLNRLSKITSEVDKEKLVGFDGKAINKTTNKVRYMTDDEFFNASVALGEFNKTYFEKNGRKMINLIKNDKSTAAKEFERIFKNTNKRAVEAISEGISTPDGILSYIKRTWNGSGKRSITETQTTDAE